MSTLKVPVTLKSKSKALNRITTYGTRYQAAKPACLTTWAFTGLRSFNQSITNTEHNENYFPIQALHLFSFISHLRFPQMPNST